jgi:hypothetical protein
LIARLVEEYPDGWALSTSSTTLQYVLSLCPEGVRIGAWVKTFAAFHTNPAYAWEPVVFVGGRKRKGHDRSELTVRDWLAAMPPVFQKRALDGTKGSKPEAFCYWLFDLLGLRDGDELHDLFPGSGAVSRYWRAWSGRAPEVEGEQATFLLS